MINTSANKYELYNSRVYHLKTPLMYERNYEKKLGGNISIISKCLLRRGTLATALCCVYQCGSGIIYKSGLNFPIVN